MKRLLPMKRMLALLLAGLMTAILLSFAAPSGAQQRSVVVVGDSIILGAQTPMVAAFSNAGWGINFDAAVSRSTSAGAAAIDSHWMELTDSLVINLGANDAGNTAAYRQKVEQILTSTAGVPHVYWLTIREVRDYYPAANQAVREVAAGHPNVTVLDWNAATAGSTGLTAGDGLHLTNAGAAAMTDLVAGAVVNSVLPQAGAVPAPISPPVTAPPATLPPETVPVTTLPPETVPVTTVPPATVPPTTLPPQSSTTSSRLAAIVPKSTAGGKRMEQALDSGGVDVGSALGWTLGGGFALVVVLLALGGAALGAWALVGAGAKTPE
ncbi:lysophospholipase L1-like esterase [Actinobacteria bacterium IMCC26207]|nr:lysophospholipase L1-like esterase [Actinobacteria bacterium IMCC26207]